MKKVNQMVFNPMKRAKGRLKRTLEWIIKRDLRLNGISKSLISNQN